MHWMSFQYLGGKFHCGKPWSPYGIAYALPDCSSIEGPQGTAAPFQNTLNYGNPGQPHDTRGYPQLTSWSKDNLTYEGMYYRWVQRAYLGGLRMMVMGINENRVLCELQANRETNCNEMDTVRTGFKAIRQLQRYVDAQAGGPGKGFFQIVTNPYDARKVIAKGKMAVVLEVEVSELFNCRDLAQPTCNTAERRPRDRRDAPARRALDAPAQQVRQPAGRRAVRLGHDGRADQRRQQGQRRVLLEREDLQGQAPRQRDLLTQSPGRRGAVRAAQPGRPGQRRPRPRLSPGAALQHARADRARPPRGRPDDGPAHDRQPRPHEPGGGVEHARRAREAPLLRRDLPARLDGPGQLAAAVEARRPGLPRPLERDHLRRRLEEVPPAQDPVRPRLGLRRRPRRPLPPAGQRRQDRAEVPVQELRRPRHLHQAEDGRSHLRLHEGGRLAVRPVRRLVRRPAPPRRPAAGPRHEPGRRGLPRDVGARRRDQGAGLRVHAAPRSAAAACATSTSA